MWIHQHSEIPDAWKMWIHSYNSNGKVDTCLNSNVSTYSTYATSLGKHLYIVMCPQFEEKKYTKIIKTDGFIVYDYFYVIVLLP